MNECERMPMQIQTCAWRRSNELLLPKVDPRRIIMLHSDHLGTPEERPLEVQEDEGAPLVVLSTDVAARGITLRRPDAHFYISA